jgi:hypothetical protein
MSLAIAAVILSLALIFGAAVAVAERSEPTPAWVGGQLTYIFWGPLLIGLVCTSIGLTIQFALDFKAERLGVVEVALMAASAVATAAAWKKLELGAKLRAYELRAAPAQPGLSKVVSGPACNDPCKPTRPRNAA